MRRVLVLGLLAACVPAPSRPWPPELRTIRFGLEQTEPWREPLGGRSSLHLVAIPVDFGGLDWDGVRVGPPSEVVPPADSAEGRSGSFMDVAVPRDRSYVIMVHRVGDLPTQPGPALFWLEWSDGHGGTSVVLPPGESDVDLGMAPWIGRVERTPQGLRVGEANNPLRQSDGDGDGVVDLVDEDDDGDRVPDTLDPDADGLDEAALVEHLHAW